MKRLLIGIFSFSEPSLSFLPMSRLSPLTISKFQFYLFLFWRLNSLPKWYDKHNRPNKWWDSISKLRKLWSKRDKMLEDWSSSTFFRHRNILSRVRLKKFFLRYTLRFHLSYCINISSSQNLLGAFLSSRSDHEGIEMYYHACNYQII